MYAMPCDIGMSWNGTNCTGTRSSLSWNNGTGNVMPEYTGNLITGKANTATLAASTDAGSPYAAASNCYNSTAYGYAVGTWFLPSHDELNLLYLNLSAIGGFSTGSNYWTSSESTNYNYAAWYQNFSSGLQTTTNKFTSYAVRCIRR
jgi:hypothetical protein